MVGNKPSLDSGPRWLSTDHGCHLNPNMFPVWSVSNDKKYRTLPSIRTLLSPCSPDVIPSRTDDAIASISVFKPLFRLLSTPPYPAGHIGICLAWKPDLVNGLPHTSVVLASSNLP